MICFHVRLTLSPSTSTRSPESAISRARVVAGDAGDTITVWEVETGRQAHVLVGHREDIATLAVSPDGRLLASGSNDADIRLWDMATGQSLKTLTGHTNAVRSVAFSPDGQTLASGSVDRTVHMWDVCSGQALQTLQGHADAVVSVAFSPAAPGRHRRIGSHCIGRTGRGSISAFRPVA